jgi:signal transduction histidine kinase
MYGRASGGTQTRRTPASSVAPVAQLSGLPASLACSVCEPPQANELMAAFTKRAVIPLGIGAGLAVEWVFYDATSGPALAAADFLVGCVLIVGGVAVWERRPESRVGPLELLTAAAWFLGNLGGPAVYFHRGPLAHLVLSYPTGRLPGRLTAAVVAAAYVDALVEPIASNDTVTIALAVAIVAAAASSFRRTSGPAREARRRALGAAVGFSGALSLAALSRAAGWGHGHVVLSLYDLAVAWIGFTLSVDLLRARWAESAVSGLIVDLGSASDTAGLRGRLARALGDPSLVVGYRLPESGDLVDDAGRPVQLPPPGSGKVATRVGAPGEEVAVLVHDEALAAEAELIESVSAAARIAVANARLQAEARRRAAELEESRRRIVETTDRQRRRLEQELRLGPGRLLEGAAAGLAAARASGFAAVAALEQELETARRELHEFAQGIRPAALAEGGLTPALDLLVARSPIPVQVRGAIGRLTEPVEAALYFVCSEGIANAVKHARSSRVTIDLHEEEGVVAVVVADDGVGGASLDEGTGLRGLADRLEALGGRLSVASPSGGGTRLVASIATAAPEDGR